jgi:hypothetical protein
MSDEPVSVHVGRVYRNTKKNTRYRVEMLATHSETEDAMVVYTDLATGRHFARPLDSFTGCRTAADGAQIPRFILESDDVDS